MGPRDVDGGLLDALARRHVLQSRGEAVPIVAPAAVAGVLGVVPRRVERVGQRHEAPRQEIVVADLKGIKDALNKGFSSTMLCDCEFRNGTFVMRMIRVSRTCSVMHI